MGTVTIRNYLFPIHFGYKGWNVEMNDKTGLFSMKDLKVKVKIQASAESLASTTTRIIVQNYNGYDLSIYTTPKKFQEIHNEIYDKYLLYAKKFLPNERVIEYSFGINGGMWDRFWGQNISATEKAQKQVVEYIDRNLGDIWQQYLDFLKQNE